MAVTQGDEKGESSMTAAKKAIKPNANGIANYELPWYESLLWNITQLLTII
jgi:replication factor C subunit 2/4